MNYINFQAETCWKCEQEFDMDSWIDRHDETVEDEWGREHDAVYHAECCPSCWPASTGEVNDEWF